MARILFGVTGGIAAYKALELVRELTRRSHSVRVLQTRSSTRFVGKASFQALTGAPVLCDEFEEDPLFGFFPGEEQQYFDQPISHLALAQRAELFLIAPASAQTIAAIAHGFADSFISTAALAATCQVIVAPAMNHAMWHNVATQENIALLQSRGYLVVPPGRGRLASRGEWGDGRLADLEQILDVIERSFATKEVDQPLSGKHALVTAGGTREAIDAVRYIGNRSSGKMGFALARALRDQGANVTVIAANVNLERDLGISYLDVESGRELQTLCHQLFPTTDLLIMAAAVGDYQPDTVYEGKLAKSNQQNIELKLNQTADILAELGAMKRSEQYLVGFSAEHGEEQGMIDHAREKLAKKHVDMIIANNIARQDIGFESDHNQVTLVTRDDRLTLERQSKNILARQIIDQLLEKYIVA